MSRISEKVHPLLKIHVVEKLNKRNIHTVNEFLDKDAEDLMKYSGLKYQNVMDIKAAILTSQGSQVQNASFFIKQIFQRGKVSSGIDKLDHILNGGFECGLIYEFCGPSPCGKSQICMSAAASVCAADELVFYIDTKGDVSGGRLVSNLQGKVTSVASALSKMLLSEPRNPYTLITALHELAKETNKKSLRLLIIDSLAALFIPLSGDHTESVGLLSTVSSFLQFIANEYCLPVIVTNLTTKWHGPDTDPVQKASLGRYWEHIPSTRISMSQLSGNDILLTITKSSMLPIGPSCTLKVYESGVQ